MFYVVKIKNAICASVAVAAVFIMTFAFAATAENAEKVELPIIMYHSVLKDNSVSPKYTVTPRQLECDLKYLKENGYEAITVSDLIDYTKGSKKLPKKPVMLTFDDGYYNNLYYAYPLVEKYGMKMVVSVVGKFTDDFSETDDSNPNYSHLTWAQIDEMQKSETVEIQNHTYNLHSLSPRMGCQKLNGESAKEYEKLLSDDLTKLQQKLKEKTGIAPNAFTYPFGSVSRESLDIIKKLGFKASFSCNEGINEITKDPKCLYMLKRFIRPSGLSSEDYFNKILRQIQ